MSDSKNEANVNRVIALAGLFQSAKLVNELAKNGRCDNHDFDTLIQSLFVFDPKTTLDTYGNDLRNLHTGLTLLTFIDSKQQDRESADILRYAVSMLAVQKKLMKEHAMLDIIKNRLTHAQFNQQHFSADDSSLPGSISALYQDTISTFKFRIQVNGNPDYLKQPAISDKIRALLFAGIRAGMLWRQLGGSKWQIIFGRADISKISHQLLNEM